MQITVDQQDPRASFAVVGDLHLTIQELGTLLPDLALPTKDNGKLRYVRVDYMPGRAWHHLTKADGSQELGPIPWEAGDRALLRLTEIGAQLAALRVSKGHPEDGARKMTGTEREVQPR